MALSKAELERKTDILTTNGTQPAAQAVIAAVGYPTEKLAAGQALLSAFRSSRAARQTLLAAQKRATKAEAQA